MERLSREEKTEMAVESGKITSLLKLLIAGILYSALQVHTPTFNGDNIVRIRPLMTFQPNAAEYISPSISPLRFRHVPRIPSSYD
jgi:hypothetical protein